MYVLSWRTVSLLIRELFWYSFPSLRKLRNSGNKHQNNPLVSAEMIRHSSTYIILYKHYAYGSHFRVVSSFSFIPSGMNRIE